MVSETATSGSLELKLSRREFAGTIVALQIFLLLAALDQTVITTAMPRIVEQLGGFDRYAWATTAYLLTSTMAVPVLGKVSDSIGRKITLLSGVALFIAASMLCGTAGIYGHLPLDPMNQLIYARAVQGIGGGAIVSLCFSVVGDLLPPATRGNYQGLFAAVFALASIIGPALGGYVADILTWRWLFFINLPVGLLGMLLFYVSFPTQKKRAQKVAFDFAGIAAFCAGTAALLLGLTRQETGSFQWLWLSLAVAIFALFIRLEKKAKQPFLPLSLFSNKTIVISAFSLAVTGVGLFGSTLLIPLFMQSVIGLSALQSGALLSPLVITVAIFSVVGGFWMSKTGKYKAVITTGFLSMTAGAFLLSTIGLTSSIISILLFMLLVGAGLGLLLPIHSVVMQNALEDDMLGTITGMSQFFRSLGGTIGVAGFGALMLFFYNTQLPINLPADLPPSVMQTMNAPLSSKQLLLDIQTNLQSCPDSLNLAQHLVLHVRQALVWAITSVFRLYALLLLAALVANQLLAELPLRQIKIAVPRSETPEQTRKR
jgi:EmrB/QacA subfamily drug resistance transporter